MHEKRITADQGVPLRQRFVHGLLFIQKQPFRRAGVLTSPRNTNVKSLGSVCWSKIWLTD